MKIAIKREQRQAALGYAERAQFGAKLKTTKLFFMAALALTFAACSNDDNELQNPAQQPQKAEGIPFTATISVGGSATTRALSEGASGITATWAEGEKVALIHNGVNDEMTVESVSEGVATIKGTITGSPKTGDAVTIIYPSTAADGTTGNVKAGLLAVQVGMLTGTGGASIAEKYDVRKGTGTLKVNGTASFNGNVTLENQFAIFEFTTQNGESPLSVTSLTVTTGGQNYVIVPASATGTLYAALPAVSGQAVTFTATTSDSKTYTASKANVTFAVGKYYQSVIKMTEAPTPSYNQEKSINAGAVTVPAGEHWLIKGTGTATSNPITIGDGATVTLDGVNIEGENSTNYMYAGITCSGDATIILEDGSTNTVKGFYDGCPGISVPENKTLTIKGTGSLTTSSNGYGAGIGGGHNRACGNIEILGGDIEATGGTNAAGIGGGYAQPCGNITIIGGTIKATGGSYAAGIGDGGSSSNSSCGNITITTGVTSVTAKAGTYANSIGSGNMGTCTSVTFGTSQVFDGTAWSSMADGNSYGGLTLAISGSTWTLTPMP